MQLFIGDWVLQNATSGIVSTDGVMGGQPRIDGRRISVLQIVEWIHEEGDSLEPTREETEGFFLDLGDGVFERVDEDGDTIGFEVLNVPSRRERGLPFDVTFEKRSSGALMIVSNAKNGMGRSATAVAGWGQRVYGTLFSVPRDRRSCRPRR